jgi:hypothetical protein
MGVASIFENFVINCVWNTKTKEQIDTKKKYETLYNIATQNEIHILPIKDSFQLHNLFPITNHVDRWNTFVIGNDMTYILQCVRDMPGFPDVALENNRGLGVLPPELEAFFNLCGI